MKYVILGMAGHVDHGKTALVRQLTGRDTDTLPEEKKRGVSIDLGFAVLYGPGVTVGIVDVPGHAHYSKNMLAGAGGVQMALLVIAADEGVRAQTREHLAALSYFGVKQGVVVLTKIDKVDEECLSLARCEARELVSGTFLENAPLCYCSASSGAGVETVRTAICAVAARVVGRERQALFRMWVDKAFLVKGRGVVVTGSVLSGMLRVGGRVYIGAREARARGLQCDHKDAPFVAAGQRAAINLSGVSLAQVGRGALLCQIPLPASRDWDVAVLGPADWRPGQRVVASIGTGQFTGRLHRWPSAPAGYARLRLERDLAAAVGDRGVLRLYSPQTLLGGVVLLGWSRRRPPPSRFALTAALDAGDRAAVVAALLAERRDGADAAELQICLPDWPRPAIEAALEALSRDGRVLALPDRLFLTADNFRRTTDDCRQELSRREAAAPTAPGITAAALAARLGVAERTAAALASVWERQGAAVLLEGVVVSPAKAARYASWRRLFLGRLAKEAAARDGRLFEAAACLDGLPPPFPWQHIQHILARQGELVRLGDLYVYRETMRDVVQKLAGFFKGHECLRVADLRDLMHASRADALLVLTYLDQRRYTVKTGDVRRAGPAMRAHCE